MSLHATLRATSMTAPCTRVAELEGLRDLEASELGPNVSLELWCGDRRPVLEHHERDRYLSPRVVRSRHDGAFHHRGMRHDRVLDLDRADVLAAANDDVLRA